MPISNNEAQKIAQGAIDGYKDLLRRHGGSSADAVIDASIALADARKKLQETPSPANLQKYEQTILTEQLAKERVRNPFPDNFSPIQKTNLQNEAGKLGTESSRYTSHNDLIQKSEIRIDAAAKGVPDPLKPGTAAGDAPIISSDVHSALDNATQHVSDPTHAKSAANMLKNAEGVEHAVSTEKTVLQAENIINNIVSDGLNSLKSAPTTVPAPIAASVPEHEFADLLKKPAQSFWERPPEGAPVVVEAKIVGTEAGIIGEEVAKVTSVAKKIPGLGNAITAAAVVGAMTVAAVNGASASEVVHAGAQVVIPTDGLAESKKPIDQAVAGANIVAGVGTAVAIGAGVSSSVVGAVASTGVASTVGVSGALGATAGILGTTAAVVGTATGVVGVVAGAGALYVYGESLEEQARHVRDASSTLVGSAIEHAPTDPAYKKTDAFKGLSNEDKAIVELAATIKAGKDKGLSGYDQAPQIKADGTGRYVFNGSYARMEEELHKRVIDKLNGHSTTPGSNAEIDQRVADACKALGLPAPAAPAGTTPSTTAPVATPAGTTPAGTTAPSTAPIAATPPATAPGTATPVAAQQPAPAAPAQPAEGTTTTAANTNQMGTYTGRNRPPSMNTVKADTAQTVAEKTDKDERDEKAAQKHETTKPDVDKKSVVTADATPHKPHKSLMEMRA